MDAGMMFWWAPRPSRQALALGPSTVFWVAVYAWTVVYRQDGHITENISALAWEAKAICEKALSILFTTVKMTLVFRLTATYHESLLNAKVIMDDFGQGGQAVGGAGGIAINRNTNSLTTRLLDSVLLSYIQ